MSFLSELVRVVTRKPAASMDLSKLREIEEYLVMGDLQKGIAEIDNYIDSLTEDEAFAKSYMNVLKGRFYAEIQNFENSATILSTVNEMSNEHPIILNYSPVEIANVHRLKGEFTEALDELSSPEQTIESLSFVYSPYYKRVKARMNNVKAKVFNRTGKFDQSISLLQETIVLLEELENQKLKAEPLNDLGIAYASSGDSQNGLFYMEESLKIYEEVGNDQQSLKLNNNLGLFNYNLSNFDEALVYYEKALEISNKLDVKQFAASILLNLGLIYQNRGELSLAMENFESSLALFEEMNNQPFIANVKTNMGNVYQLTGEIDKSIKLYKQSQNILEELDSKNELAVLYTSMASAYNDKGLKPKGLDLVNKSVELLEEVHNYDYMCYPIQLGIEILMDQNKTEEAEQLLGKFEEYLDKMKSKAGTQLYKLSKALILIESDRVVKQAEAQTLLTELAEGEDISIQYAVKAYLKLAELLLRELKLSASEAALEEFKDMINRLTKLTESGGDDASITPTKVNVYILRSKLAIIDLDIAEAQKLLEDAHSIAKNNGLKQLAKAVKEEQDAVKNQMMKFKQMVDTNASLYERLQESQIENYLKRAENILKK